MEIGQFGGIRYGNEYVKLEGSSLVESLESEGGTEIGLSNVSLYRKDDGKFEVT